MIDDINFVLSWSLLAAQRFSAAEAAEMTLQSDIESEADDPEFDDSDSRYSADSTSSSSYTESDSESDANISEEAAVIQQTDYVLDSQRPLKRVRTRGGLTNWAPLKSVPSRSTMPPANVDIKDTQATPVGVSVTNRNAEALSSNKPHGAYRVK